MSTRSKNNSPTTYTAAEKLSPIQPIPQSNTNVEPVSAPNAQTCKCETVVTLGVRVTRYPALTNCYFVSGGKPRNACLTSGCSLTSRAEASEECRNPSARSSHLVARFSQCDFSEELEARIAS